MSYELKVFSEEKLFFHVFVKSKDGYKVFFDLNDKYKGIFEDFLKEGSKFNFLINPLEKNVPVKKNGFQENLFLFNDFLINVGGFSTTLQKVS